MKRKVTKTLLFLATQLFVVLVGLELAVRLWGYSEHHIYDPIYQPFVGTAEIAYIHKPNLVNVRARGLAIINTDVLGLRSKTPGLPYLPKPEHEYRIALVGDSVTFGEGVPQTVDTYAQVLEDTLNHQQKDVHVRVFNFGASAYSVKEMAATLQYRMLEVKPDLVVMAIIPADFDLARTPSVDAAGYLVDQRIGSLNKLLPKDSPIRAMLRSLRLLYPLRDVIYAWSVNRPGFTGQSAHDLLPDSYLYVRRFNEIAQQQNVSSLVVLLPKQFDDLGDVKRQMHEDGIEVADLVSLGHEFTHEQFRASPFDIHPSVAVHRRTGEALAEYVLRHRLRADRF